MTATPYNFRVHIHLGAHKTASTFIQTWLAKNQGFLTDNHIAYVPLGKLRKCFSLEFSRLSKSTEDVTPAMVEQLRDILFAEAESCGFDLASTRLFILSEENILGSVASLSATGVLYPDIKKRMALLARIFENYEIQPFLALRNYCEFYPSAYAERLRQGHVKPFDNYVGKLNLLGNSWTNIIESIEAELGMTKLWSYEQFRGNAHIILSELLQIAITPNMINVDNIARKSLTKKGLDVVMMSKKTLSVGEMKKLINLLAERMVFDAPDEKIAIKNIDTLSFLNKQYCNDLNQLSNRLIIVKESL
jgi:hypothetical protein